MRTRTNPFSRRSLTFLLLATSPLFLLGQEPGCDADADGDGWTTTDGDCDDSDESVHPGAEEVCDGVDNDCDGEVDNNPDAADATWYTDGDGDGYGDDTTGVLSCESPGDGYVIDGGDCDDLDPRINPGADERCDDIDNDCNGVVDDHPDSGGSMYAADEDGDGFGSATETERACSGPDNTLDCDDTDALEPQVVRSDADTSLADGSIDYPWATIQEGINYASQCVVVYEGIYSEAIDFAGNSVAVTGVDGEDVTIIDATGQGQPVVTFATEESADASLSGFTLTGGTGYLSTAEDATECGSTETCTTYTYSYCGGGVFIDGATPTLSALSITGNSLPSAGVEEVGNDTFYTYSFGGGVCVMAAVVGLSQVDLWNNYADVGSGLYLDTRAIVDFSEGFIGGNSATEGGGIAVDGGRLNLTNAASAYNQADSGGGLVALDATLSEINVTHGGETSSATGAVYLYGGSSATVKNTIIYGSTAGVGILADETATFEGSYNNVYGNAGGEYSGVEDPTGSDGNLSEDPLLTSMSDDGDATNEDFHLMEGSPSIDAGDPSAQYNDADRSVNDQGAFGGPGSTWAD